MSAKKLNREELESALPEILDSPRDVGVLALIVQRPDVGQRHTVDTGVLSVADGLVGDNWKLRGKPHPEMQLTIMNSRVAALVAQDPQRRQLAGDQLTLRR